MLLERFLDLFLLGRCDEDQVEEAPEAQAQEAQGQVGAQAQTMSSRFFMPQRITRSKAKALGEEHH